VNEPGGRNSLYSTLRAHADLGLPVGRGVGHHAPSIRLGDLDSFTVLMHSARLTHSLLGITMEFGCAVIETTKVNDQAADKLGLVIRIGMGKAM
jgi:hypothetical protein